jgi:hypothetical protein
MYAKDFFYIYDKSGYRLIANITFYREGGFSLGFNGAIPKERRENNFWVEGNCYNPTSDEIQKLRRLKFENKLLEFSNTLAHDVDDYGGAYHSRNFPC